MNRPLGNNPIGEHAPGLPRHDKPLPGHVPGAAPMQLGGGDSTPANGGFNTAYTGPGIPMAMAKPIAWFVFYVGMYLTAPLQAVLYPIAGVAGPRRRRRRLPAGAPRWRRLRHRP